MRNSDFQYQGLKVDHAGDWDPSKYRNYVDPDSLKRGYEGKQLPKARPSQPKKTKQTITKADVEYHSLHSSAEIERLSKLHPEHLNSIDR